MSKGSSFHQYDVVIIGAGLGGLTSAILLAKEGLKVLVAEKNSYAGGCCNSFKKDGYVFNTGPSLFFGAEKGGYLHELFDYLGIEESVKADNLFRKIDPGLQVAFPGHRLDIYSERERFFKELEREFPKDVATLKEFYLALDSINSEIFEKYNHYPFNIRVNESRSTDRLKRIFPLTLRSLKRMGLPKGLKSFFTKYKWDEGLKDFFDLQTMFFGQVDSFDASLPFLANVLSIPTKGLFYPAQGNRAFADLITERFLELGGEIRDNIKVFDILLDRYKTRGVRFERGAVTESILARKTVVNTSIFNLEGLIHEELPRRRLARKFSPLRNEWTMFSLFLGIDNGVVPESMKENLIIHRNDEKARGGKRILYVHTGPEWDKKRAPQGKRALTAISLLPVDEWEGEEEGLIEKNTERIIEDLKEIIPFIQGNFEIVDVLTPSSLEKLILRPKGAVGNLKGDYRKGRFGFYGLPHKLPLKNLFLVGEGAYPGYGTAHVMFSGFHAAKRILRSL